jgi:hypothetical protein
MPALLHGHRRTVGCILLGSDKQWLVLSLCKLEFPTRWSGAWNLEEVDSTTVRTPEASLGDSF